MTTEDEIWAVILSVMNECGKCGCAFDGDIPDCDCECHAGMG